MNREDIPYQGKVKLEKGLILRVKAKPGQHAQGMANDTKLRA